jgi:hypothetical protein
MSPLSSNVAGSAGFQYPGGPTSDWDPSPPSPSPPSPPANAPLLRAGDWTERACSEATKSLNELASKVVLCGTPLPRAGEPAAADAELLAAAASRLLRAVFPVAAARSWGSAAAGKAAAAAAGEAFVRDAARRIFVKAICLRGWEVVEKLTARDKRVQIPTQVQRSEEGKGKSQAGGFVSGSQIGSLRTTQKKKSPPRLKRLRIENFFAFALLCTLISHLHIIFSFFGASAQRSSRSSSPPRTGSELCRAYSFCRSSRRFFSGHP